MLTAQEDLTADAVIAELDRCGAEVRRMDTGDFPIRSQLSASISTSGWRGRLTAQGVEVDLEEVRSVYYRRPTRFTFPEGLSGADAVFAATEARLGLGGVLGALDALWVNHPGRVAIAEYKPIQLRVATRCGLRIPRTLITNDKSVAVGFAGSVRGRVVCKTLSSLVLSERGVPQVIYTTPVDAATIDPAALATTTHLVQEWVPKHYDARVTVVGRRAFAVAIEAGSERCRLDWRSGYASLAYRTVDPPPEVVSAAVRFLRRLGLAFGAFDFVVTPAGEWVMLECNPAGQWLWLQDEVGVEIGAALADLLVSGRQQ